MAKMIKTLPAMRETWVWSLGWEDTLEESMVTHSSILAWGIPMDRALEGYSPWGRKESDMTEWLSTAKKKNRFLVTGNVSEGSKPVMLRPYVWWIMSKRGLFNFCVWLLKEENPNPEKWFTQHRIESQQSQNSMSAL